MLSLLIINPVLNRVPQILYLADQPRRRHRDSERTDEKRHHQQDNPVCNLMGNQSQHTEDAEDRSRKAEHPRRAVQQTGANPDENGQNHNDRSDEYFQYQPHKSAPFTISNITITPMLFFARMRQKNSGAAYMV